MKIATRLLGLFFLVAVFPLSLFSYIDLQQYEETVRDESLERLAGLADKKVMQVNNYLEEREREVRILARGPQVIAGLRSLYAKELHGVGNMGAERGLHDYFSRYIEETGLFYDAFLISIEGEIVFTQKHESDFKTNLLAGPYRDTQFAKAFRSARMTLEPVISDYEFYAPSQSPAIFIIAPVMVEGRCQGMFAAQLDNKLLYRVATDATDLGQTGGVAFAQRDRGDVLYTTPLKYHEDAAMKFRVKEGEIRQLPMLEALAGKTGEGIKVDYRGTPVVAAWRYLPGLNWGMVVEIDLAEEFAPVYQHRLRLFEMLGAMLLGIGLLAYYFGRQISRPLARLANTANAIARGELAQKVEESGPGELSLFARAFNHMLENLRQLYHSLEQRIEQRTVELNVINEQLKNEIANHKRTEVMLSDAHENLVRLLNSMVEGAYGVDTEGNCTFVNPSCLRMLGYQSTDELLGKQMHKLIHHTHADGSPYPVSACKIYQAYQMLQTISVADEVFWRKDGSCFPVEYWSSPIVIDGVSVGAILTFIDITERKQADDKLRLAAATFETHEGIMITDAQANIIRVNRAFGEITGFSAEEVLGKNPRILSSGRQSKAFYEQMWHQLKTEGGWSGEIWDRRKNGEIYPKWLTITAVKDSAGRVTEFVAIFGDITARKRAEEEIRNLAFYDVLTQLPNRRLLLDRLGLALSVSARSQQYGAVLFLDMDKFKVLNDTLGHDYGDMLLLEVARRLRDCVRDVDTVARLGGDEFVVLIEELDVQVEEASQKVALIAEKIRVSLSEPYLLKARLHHSSPSIGVSLYRGTEESVDALLKHADMAMYQSKEAGRNTVRFFDPQMQHLVETRASLEADLRRAVPEGQLQLYYQIQLNNENQPLGAEALLRWMHPLRGMVSPAQFIPVAEESAQILEIGTWVLESACHQLSLWCADKPTRNLSIAVNVSAQQFKLVNFVDQIASLLRKYHVDAARLKLELTESVVLNDVDDVVEKMHALRALGVQLSLDDFGTGYSSLAYLKRLPLNQLKIDQSFVRDITSDANDAVMVRTIIDMAHNFGMNVIAEGVETDGQLAFLKQHGCMAYQGYLFSKPVPIEQLEDLLASQPINMKLLTNFS